MGWLSMLPKTISILGWICVALLLLELDSRQKACLIQEPVQPTNRHRHHSSSHMKEANINGACIIPELTDYEQFYDYITNPKATCKDLTRVGNSRQKDGPKWVCLDKGFKPNDCVVYSFGINNEWTFDDAVDKYRKCQVFAFDPSMGAEDHERSKRISFFNLGISNFRGYTMIKNIKSKMERYRGIVEMLGHKSKKIDYLKMDIEGSEIPFFEDVLDNDQALLDNVQQIGLEIHPQYPDSTNKRFKDYWEIFHHLECLGWRLLNVEMNQNKNKNHFTFNEKTRSNCYELVWIRN